MTFRYAKNWKLIENFQKINIQFFPLSEKLKIELKIAQNQIFICLKLLKIENWIENCQKINFQFFSLSEKLKIELKNCPKSIFFFLKLLKIGQKWNGRFRTRMRVPNVHSNFNQVLLKIELKIAKFQFSIYFQFSIFNLYCLHSLIQFLINKNWKIELKMKNWKLKIKN